jgi:Phosphotransferase enzyme family
VRGSAHERYRDRLAAVPAPPPGWSRHYARFEPGRSPWLTLVDLGPGPEPAAVTTELFDGRPPAVRRFPADDRLPGLAAVVRSVDRCEVVRYRPGRRCTLHVATDAGWRWVKVLRDGEGERLVAESGQLWRAAAGGHLGFAVAEPDRYDPATGAAWHHEVPGQPVEDLVLGPGAGAVAERLGRALGRLGRAPVAPATTTGRADQLARTGRAVERAARAVPPLAGRLRERLAGLAAAADALPPERSVPIHGAPHVHQWLLDGDRLGLVDFDRFAVGEPELDLATFVAELRSERRLTVDLDVIEASLCAGYESTGVPVDPAVLAWYRAHKLLAKVTRAAWSVRPDGDDRAARHLADATA